MNCGNVAMSEHTVDQLINLVLVKQTPFKSKLVIASFPNCSAHARVQTLASYDSRYAAVSA